MPQDVYRPLRQFLTGVKLHVEEHIALAFGKGVEQHQWEEPKPLRTDCVTDILQRSYDVSCVLPGWMSNLPIIKEDLASQIEDIFPGNFTCHLEPTACLTYYLSRTKKAVFKDRDTFLHCSIDEVYSVSIATSSREMLTVADYLDSLLLQGVLGTRQPLSLGK